MGDLVSIAEKHQCAVAADWDIYRKRQLKALREISALHAKLDDMANHTVHLEQLKKLDALVEIRDRLLNSATGRHHIDLPTFGLVVKVLGTVIIGLTIVILSLLLGENFGIVSKFFRG